MTMQNPKWEILNPKYEARNKLIIREAEDGKIVHRG